MAEESNGQSQHARERSRTNANSAGGRATGYPLRYCTSIYLLAGLICCQRPQKL